MNQKFIHSAILSSVLVFSLQANAAGFKQDANQHGKIMSSAEFYQVLAQTKPDQVAVNFGFPDQIQTLKNPAGQTEGVIWVYRDAVKKAEGMKDVNIMIIEGEMKYVTLTSAS